MVLIIIMLHLAMSQCELKTTARDYSGQITKMEFKFI